MLTRRAVLTAAAAGVAGGVLVEGAAHADATITINPSADYGVWQGWGTSLAWWANVFGDRDDFADLPGTMLTAIAPASAATP